MTPHDYHILVDSLYQLRRATEFTLRVVQKPESIARAQADKDALDRVIAIAEKCERDAREGVI